MRKLLYVTSVVSIIVGLVMIVGGGWGILFTYKAVTAEKITTPADANIPGVSVRGPITLKVQADTIRKHTLEATGGKTFAEMPRQIAKLDEKGQPVFDNDGKPVMVANTARDMWVTANVLMTALNLGIFSYAFSALALVLGVMFTWMGVVFCYLSKKY